MKTVYLYHHIPKCGGISFIRTCEKWFTETLRENTGSYPTREQTEAFARTRIDFDALPDKTFISGHLVRPGIRPYERYGDHIASGACRLVTIFRDPLERAISSYFHRRRIGREWPASLEDWTTRGRNAFAKYLDVTPETFRSRLDEYFLVGTTESLQLTIDIFAKKSGSPRVEVLHLNTSPRTANQLSAEAIRGFEQRNALDYEIFRYATDRVRREAAELGLA